jgi:hypothetical protein
MPEVVFVDLVEIYRNTRFGDAGDGTLTVASARIAAVLAQAEDDASLYDRIQIASIGDSTPALGDVVRITVGSPSPSLGLLLPDFDSLFKAPGAAFVEPDPYYVVDAAYASGDQPPPDELTRYRAALDVVAVMREAAAYVDEGRRELVFLGAEKVLVPIRFDVADLSGDLATQASLIRQLFNDPLHGAEKAALLSTAVIELVGSQRPAARFAYLLRNVDRIRGEVEKGYRLFASSFSYSKIRDDVETARIDFIGKIHKTIVDIQGQLLGIPVATIVVASQLKAAPDCGSPFWTNAAVVLGAWIFVALLGIAVHNQRRTLDILGVEIVRQEKRLRDDYAAVSDQFEDQFDDLTGRVRWHRHALDIIVVIAALGVALATFTFLHLTARGSIVCLTQNSIQTIDRAAPHTDVVKK